MTPQEQIEELARKYDNLEAAYYANEELSNFWPDKRVARLRAKDAHQVAVNLRAIRFDSPQISEGEDPLRVTVDGADLIELLYGATTDSPANRKARTRLRAALTQKGEA